MSLKTCYENIYQPKKPWGINVFMNLRPIKTVDKNIWDPELKK